MNVGRSWVPRVKSRSRDRELVPHCVALCDGFVGALEHLRQNAGLNSLKAQNTKFICIQNLIGFT